ncbi:MAG: hypothetical protein ACLGIN_03960 [Candidatus Sericytochromatia bacterium]
MRRRAAIAAILVLLAGCEAPVPPSTELVFLLPPVKREALSTSPAPSEAPDPDHSPVPSPSPSHGQSGNPGRGGGGAPPQPGGLTIATADGYGLARMAAPALTSVGGLAVDARGVVYVSDTARHTVWAVPTTGAPAVVAGLGNGNPGYWGDGVPADATPLSGPTGLALDPHSGAIMLADTGNGRIRLFPPGGRITTWAGGGAPTTETVANPLAARLDQPVGLALDGEGRLLFTERGSGRLRRLESDRRVTTLATFAPGELGPIAVRWRDGLAWVGEGGRIRALDPAAPDPAASPVLELPGQVVAGLAYDQVGTLFALVSDPGGSAGTRLLRLDVGASGAALGEPEPVAGTGGTAPDPAAYEAPATPVADAREQLLTGAATNGLAIDLSHAASETVLSGHLYLGHAYDAGATRWAQVLKLTPRE